MEFGIIHLREGDAMSQRAVERALGKLVTDDEFRRRFFHAPAEASRDAGLDLTPGELEALARLPSSALARFSARVDDRIRRLPLEEGSAPEETGR